MEISREDVVQAIQDANVVDRPESLKDDIPLAEQGVDSLGVFNILLLIDEKLGVQTPDDDIEKMQTISQMVAYYANRAA